MCQALLNDWGFHLTEPFVSDFAGQYHKDAVILRFRALREKALALPKFGTGHAEVDELGKRVFGSVVDTATSVFAAPTGVVAEVLQDLKRRFSHAGRDFVYNLQVGIGTFEGYVGDGDGTGASADGRLSGQPISSDLSPVPLPSDMPPIQQNTPSAIEDNQWSNRPIYDALDAWNVDKVNTGVSNAAPVDLNLRETFPLEQLEAFLWAYIQGDVGSNLLTASVADPDTYANASEFVERYELIRVRMGGWTEYYAAMFPAHQAQHARRPFFIPQARPRRSCSGNDGSCGS